MKPRIVILSFLIFFAAGGSALGEQAKRISIDAVLGLAGEAGGIIKSFGYQLIKGFVSVEASFAVFAHTYPLSGNLTLQLPLGPFAPFITTGYGYSLSGFSVSNTGTGLKIWVSENTALLLEYRRFKYDYFGKQTTKLIGAGFAYRL